MIKRDTLVHMITSVNSDGSGGKLAKYKKDKTVNAHVSLYTSNSDITQYGIKEEYVIHVVTDNPLDENKNNRYQWSEKLFQLLVQRKGGNEWFSTLKEVNN